ncbi:hypothetical protein QKW35_05995 [Pontibacterium granulatum]|uniref:hypothetical protein n=1 Tax=Pontibacterium granulatum TaxID=2036029 RepID=UPI00249CC8D7|nr:hypothetical protein [Pontibacterium granulatum]MDI3323920.1 hypothetical protein [Pontibacterium granulatum]
MSEFESHYRTKPDTSSKKSLVDIFVTTALILVAVIGAKIPEAEWIVYIIGLLSVLSFILMVSHSKLGAWLCKKWHQRRDRVLLSKNIADYEEIFAESRVVKELVDKVERLEWGSDRPRSYSCASRSLHGLSSFYDSLHAPAYDRFLLLNYSMKESVGYIENYLRECDRLVVDRAVEFKYESERAELEKLVRQYDQFRDEHDRFCKRLNKKLRYAELLGFYGATLTFRPKELKLSATAS